MSNEAANKSVMNHDSGGERQRTSFAVWSGPERVRPGVPEWRTPRPSGAPDSAVSERDAADDQRLRMTREASRFGRSLFLDEEQRGWGWQLPLFEGFFGALPPLDDAAVPEDLDDDLPAGDMPGQLFLDLGI